MGNQQLHSRFGTTWQAFVLSFLVFWLSQSPIVHAQQPFMPVETARALSGSTLEGNVLEKRQGCISNFFSCSGVGAAFSDVCCQYGYTCALDQNNQPACCPVNAICTGTAPAGVAAPSPTAPVSFVANPYFSFPYVATYFPDAEQCSSAVSQCSANYVACSDKLDGLGGQYGVTIVVPGGAGTTVGVNVGTTVGLESASRICSSLSSVACHGLENNMCSMTATTASGFYFGTGAPNRASSRRGFTGLLVAAGVVATVSALL
ncbi:hypothetical protein NEUTE1DRAFT_88612 [Neurospora tetrasperma FGSC 2508]|uniref:Gpi-anchored protein n=1 Tax=Neurospora tetrasperma (strain FGSC 2508 / ATCC MYA-4615 / P0657) TaxID=510951 RepID=F8MXT8_NEUT8|nr:uncharacterized protein NEUTE1DRAFT_88612 [Neurospora tetrasperma FGSC 2508]EGO53883.1 hypothetical protein NEUTE1DRAFT_88612 [Neurospora tetrasperma FGSC 2508]